MKKGIVFVLTWVCAWSLAGCGSRSMNDIIANEPNMTGVVQETTDGFILIENDSGEYSVSLDVENQDSVTEFIIGDEVVVYYDGSIAEADPMRITTVYAITIKTPANRGENNRP